MLEVASDHFTLQSMKQKLEKSYREYAIKWKTTTSQVQPPLTNREINSLFMDTFPSPYYDMLIGNTFHKFEDLLYSVKRIEDGVKREEL